MIRPRLAPSAAYRRRQELARRAHLPGWWRAMAAKADMRRRWASTTLPPAEQRASQRFQFDEAGNPSPLPASSLDDEYNQAILALQRFDYRPRGGLAGGVVTPPPPAPALSGGAAAAPLPPADGPLQHPPPAVLRVYPPEPVPQPAGGAP